MDSIKACCGRTDRIAFQTENNRTQVTFDLSDIMEQFPGGTAALLIRRHGDTDVVPSSSAELIGTDLVWTVTAWECANKGYLYAQIVYSVGTVVAKTKIYRFDVSESLTATAEEPEDWEDWVDELMTAAAETQAAVDSYDAMTATASGLPAGSAPTAEIDHSGENPVLRLGLTKGDKGDPGQDGDDGYSPTAAVSKSGNTVTITITDKTGTTTAQVSDGEDGQDGEDGDDGFSPVASVSKSGKTATITIMDKTGTTTATVSDGEDGSPGDPTELIDDTAGAGETGKTWSADKLSNLKSALTSKEYHYFVWHDGYFVNTSGVISANASRSYSDMILCAGGTVCKYIGDTANASISGIAFYDKNGNFISGVANNATLGAEATVTAPANAWYCRITTRTTMKDTTYLKMDNSVVANTIKNIITYIETDSRYDLYKATATAKSVLVQSGALDSSGNAGPNDDYLRTDYIPVKTGDVIYYTICTYTSLSALAVFNASKVCTSTVLGIGTSTKLSGTFTAAADGYVRFSCYKASLDRCKIYFANSFVDDLSKMSVGQIFYCGADRELSTLKAGLEAACEYMGSTLYVDPGTYDLIDEFGSAWFEALDGTLTMVGLQLKNRVHVIFSPNSKVISHYTGDNEYAQSLYSPFNAGEYGFTLENLTLECSRCRYAIHDERNGATELYKSHYINCNVYIDNSENGYWSSRCGIGGGLGSNAEVIIENCIWGSDNPNTANARNAVYYHTSNSHSNSNHRAVVTIKDNYFITGCIQLDPGYLTTTAENSTFTITNNSFATRYNGADEQGVFHASLDPETNDLYEWNNVIRDA